MTSAPAATAAAASGLASFSSVSVSSTSSVVSTASPRARRPRRPRPRRRPASWRACWSSSVRPSLRSSSRRWSWWRASSAQPSPRRVGVVRRDGLGLGVLRGIDRRARAHAITSLVVPRFVGSWPPSPPRAWAAVSRVVRSYRSGQHEDPCQVPRFPRATRRRGDEGPERVRPPLLHGLLPQARNECNPERSHPYSVLCVHLSPVRLRASSSMTTPNPTTTYCTVSATRKFSQAKTVRPVAPTRRRAASR